MSLLSKLLGSEGRKPEATSTPRWTPGESGLSFRNLQPGLDQDCLSLFVESGKAQATPEGPLLPWTVVYEVHREDEYFGIADLLALPRIDASWKPILRSVGSFSDEQFSVDPDSWISDLDPVPRRLNRVGAALPLGSEWVLVREEVHRLLGLLDTLSDTSDHEERMRVWASARSIAVALGVSMDGFLRTSICLTPDQLRFRIHESTVGTCTVEPTFSDAPEGWLRQFDQRMSFPARVDVADPDGNQVSIFLSPEIREALRVVRKQFPRRRLDSEKGRRFARNPWSFLNDECSSVVGPMEIDPQARTHLSHSLNWRCVESDGRIEHIEVTLRSIAGEDGTESLRRLDRSELRDLTERLAGAELSEAIEFQALNRWILRGLDGSETLSQWRAILQLWDLQIESRLETRKAAQEQDPRLLELQTPWILTAEPSGTLEFGNTAASKSESVRLGMKPVEDSASLGIPADEPPSSWVRPQGLRDSITLRAHQQSGIQWLWERYPHSPKASSSGAILADDMGLGKTIQGLTFLQSLFEAHEGIEPALVVAPVSLLDNWVREAKAFLQEDSLRILKLHGSELRSRSISTEIQDPVLFERGVPRCLESGWRSGFHLVLTSYEVLRDFETSLAALPWSVVLLDEAQRIKNPSSFLAASSRAIPARFRVACTGTPVENSLRDLWSLFQFAKPGYLGPLEAFNETYRRPIEVRTQEEGSRLEELRSRIEPWILRRTKAEVASDLPPKILHSGTAAGTQLPLTSLQLDLYAQSQARFATAKERLKNRALTYMFKTLGEMRLICAVSSLTGERLPSESVPKAAWLLERLKEIQVKDEKVLIFSEFLEVQLRIREWIRARLGLEVDVLNGSTPVNGPTGRHARIEQFSRRDGFGILILGTKALGSGVNIQSANHVVHFTRSWNPAIEDQATDRSYRIGQTRTVHVHTPTMIHPAARWKTFEEVLEQLLDRKRSLATDILNGQAGDLTVDDFLEVIEG